MFGNAFVTALALAVASSPAAAQTTIFDLEARDTFRVLTPGPSQVSATPIDTRKTRSPVHFSARSKIAVPEWLYRRSSFGGVCQRAVPTFPGVSQSVQARRQRLLPLMESAACRHGIPTALFDSLIMQESAYLPTAVSHAGARGLTQLMPATAKALDVTNSFDATANIDGGARYLKRQFERFKDWKLALAAYNAGPGRVIKYSGIPPFRETRSYVARIERFAAALAHRSPQEHDATAE